MKPYFTVGVAGHIDHGKTSLTKALTGVDTDRLKEEKARSISIEPGFAPLFQEEELEASIIDVPGHENFIRQMIAGVAGIDMVIVVIAADEGIMPQTKEHLDILSLLGITNGVIAITKIGQTDPELMDIVLDDVKENIKDTFLEGASIFLVDSLSKKGVSELKEALREELQQITKKKTNLSFRLPIDQAFTVKGQGVVARGTIYDGEVRQGDRLKVLPSNEEVRVRQIQSHNKQALVASAGQRAAINLGGIAYEDISRGDVLVADDFFSVSNRIDVAFYPLKDMEFKIKQRQLVKLHIGTAEVMGSIVFFDRNEINLNESEEVLCQIQLDEKVVVTRGDRFILRRPTPVETIGGGFVIEPNAKRHRFGKDTIDELQSKKDGSAKDRVELFLRESIISSHDELLKQLAITEEELVEAASSLLEIEPRYYTLYTIFKQVQERIITLVTEFHEQYPMRTGINKAELFSELKHRYPELLLEFTMESLRKEKQVKIVQQYVSLYEVTPTLPDQWKIKLENVEKELIQQGMEVEMWGELLNKHGIPDEIQKEFYAYLVETERAFIFDEQRLLSKSALDHTLEKLKQHTELQEFNLQSAREALDLTRRNLVPLLELLDRLGYTRRVENNREWMDQS